MSEPIKNGVIICQCHGRITESLRIDEIRRFLEQRRPDTEVVLADDLCQPKAFQRFAEGQRLRPWVVGACSQLEHKRHFWQEAEALECDTYSIRIVDLLKETDAPFSTIEMTERVKLLLWAQIRRRSEFKGIPQDKLKLHFSRPEGKISRRDLFTLALPQYEVIPFIEPAGCRGRQRCRLCVDTCLLKAISVEEDEVVIDTTICDGCGACIASCPYGAIVYPTFSPGELNREMEGLLLPKDVALEPRIIAAVCQRCLPAPEENGAKGLTFPPNVLPLKVPCLALVSPGLILGAFDMGAQGFALVSGKGKCRSGIDSTQWRESVQFIQGLFDCWDIEPERIKVFEVEGDNPLSTELELGKFAQEIARLEPTPLAESEPSLLAVEGWLLPVLIKDMGSKLGNSSRGTVSTGSVPFGKIELDGSQCTGCGLCALDCATGALTVSSLEETGSYQLLFKHDYCVACGRCVEVCPEECLRLERILELDRIDSPPMVLFEDKVVSCYQCGSPVAPRAMIDRLQAKLQGAGESFTSQLELCPECRIKSQFGLGRAAGISIGSGYRHLGQTV